MAPPLIFITGSTGFIGSHTANAALAAGYKVRLSIRHPEVEHEIRKWITGPQEHVDIAHIPDLTKPEALRGILEDVDFIFHLASPMPGKGENVQSDYIDPAVSGTLTILKEAARSERVKFVIVVSSILALIPLGGMSKPPVYPKANTNERLPVDLGQVFPSGSAGYGMKYSASKILAHQATRDFLSRSKPNFKLVTFHPAFVLGDSLIQKHAKDIDGMNAMFWKSLSASQPMIPSAFVHVRDVAEAHVKALENYQVLENGTEYILSAPVFGWDKAAKVVRERYPQIEVSLEKGPFPLDDWRIDASRAEKDLGMKWRSGQAIIGDLVDQQLALKEQSNS
ncbi:related to flavonol reductase/cinnamoyl-CoA reductase [Ramularia collo-cygni]|uniref:Related to flavonol reductase/cinnamoyl-CoA reductase n=1 Tax=Ramularia collo-cygni TaxID=112498 RepID=A0A2D3UW61_9PEZI|nr:related to flavonol reductase/cinnamoyl-CoA reductase [Ramularia collo-cygni]CZT19578.1 related to flavonol reductase/cinnamoyl-CoA reductase [Ramularia collo-cygni]